MESNSLGYSNNLEQDEYICDNWAVEIRNNSNIEDVLEDNTFNDVELIFKEIKQSISNW